MNKRHKMECCRCFVSSKGELYIFAGLVIKKPIFLRIPYKLAIDLNNSLTVKIQNESNPKYEIR